MKTTSLEDTDFASELGQLMNIDLGQVVDWIKGRYSPSEIYTDEELKDFVRENYDPEQVYPNKTLERWALDNGFAE